jgi:hypothetical protein
VSQVRDTRQSKPKECVLVTRQELKLLTLGPSQSRSRTRVLALGIESGVAAHHA